MFWSDLLRRVRAAPIRLWALAAFSLAVSCGGFAWSFVAPQELQEILVPHVGWSFFAPYAVLIIILASASLRPRPLQWQAAIGVFVVYMLFDTFSLLISDPSSNNPYLRRGAFRVIWVLLIPLIWIGLIASKRSREFFSSGKT